MFATCGAIGVVALLSMRLLCKHLNDIQLVLGGMSLMTVTCAMLALPPTCIGLHGTTRYQDSGAYGPQHVSIQDHYQGGTSRQRRRAGNEAMRAIQVEDVVRACEAVLTRPSSSSQGSST